MLTRLINFGSVRAPPEYYNVASDPCILRLLPPLLCLLLSYISQSARHSPLDSIPSLGLSISLSLHVSTCSFAVINITPSYTWSHLLLSHLFTTPPHLSPSCLVPSCQTLALPTPAHSSSPCLPFQSPTCPARPVKLWRGGSVVVPAS